MASSSSATRMGTRVERERAGGTGSIASEVSDISDAFMGHLHTCNKTCHKLQRMKMARDGTIAPDDQYKLIPPAMSSLVPIAISIVFQYFPRHRRTRANTVQTP